MPNFDVVSSLFRRYTTALSFLAPLLACAQSQYRFEQFSIKNGLSQNTVQCVLQDSEGYYWLGTQDGLNRYDGYTVKVFRHDREDTNTLSDNFILTLIEGDNGNLWVGTRNGFNCLERRSGLVHRIIAKPQERKDYHNSVWNAVKNAAGDILFSNSYGEVVKISGEDAKQPPFHPTVMLQRSLLTRSSASSYCIFNSKTNQLSSYGLSGTKRWELDETTAFLRQQTLETNAELLLGADSGLIVVNLKNSQRRNLLKGKRVTALLTDGKGNIWVGTDQGLYIYKSGNLSAGPAFLSHNADDPFSPGSNGVQAIYEDRNGLVWVGTAEGGVSVYDPLKAAFRVFNHYSEVPLSENAAWAILQDKNELWVGTYNGLNHFTFENPLVTDVFEDRNKVLSREVLLRDQRYPASLCNNFVTSLARDGQGRIWCGTQEGISVYDPKNRKWEQLHTKNSALQSDRIFHLMCASDGRIWISTLMGFYAYDPATKHMASFLSKSQGGDFVSNYIISTYEDSDGSIWAGSTHGVYHIGAKGERIRDYFNEPGNKQSLSYNMGTSFLRDSAGRFWVGTLGGGLNLLNEKDNSFEAFTQKDGLASDIVYTVIEDRSHQLWVSTNAGVSRFDPESKIFTNYTKSDGLAEAESCQNAAFINAAGELFFGSPEGLTVFKPEEVARPPAMVPIVLTALQVNYEARPFAGMNELQLYYGDKTVSFEFAAPSFRNQEKVQYAFRLEGFDNEWREASAFNRLASYTNLPFGNYIFKVSARVGSGPWQEKTLMLPVTVVPPWWLTTWFIALASVCALGLVILLVKYYAQRRLKRQLREAELQRKIHLEKERISRDLHDNIGAQLTYITTSLDNIAYNSGAKNALPVEKINSLSNFSRHTMQQLRETIWAINKENISVEELKSRMQEYCLRMTEAGNIQVKVEFNDGRDLLLKPSYAINIYRIVQEAINNAVKHSKARELRLLVSECEGRNLHIEVADNGVGMNNGSPAGYGLRNMQDRVKEIKGSFLIESEAGKGTKVKVSFPL